MADSKQGFEVTEDQAKCFRIWEEVGGPKYCNFEDAVSFFYQMTPTEQGEVPTWRRAEDPDFLHYYLPRRFWPKSGYDPR